MNFEFNSKLNIQSSKLNKKRKQKNKVISNQLAKQMRKAGGSMKKVISDQSSVDQGEEANYNGIWFCSSHSVAFGSFAQ
jgi:hypothetical protein